MLLQDKLHETLPNATYPAMIEILLSLIIVVKK